MITFGEVSLNDIELDKKSGNSKDLWLKLERGDNEVRLLTNPYQYLHHRYKKDPTNPKDFGIKIRCSQANGSCPLCDIGNEAKPRWLYGVIDRRSKAYRILDVSTAILGPVKKLNAGKWGDPKNYDLNIIVDPNAGPAGYYTVQPMGKEPLSVEDQKIKDNVDLNELKVKVSPLDAATVAKLMQKVAGGPGGSLHDAPKVANKPAGKVAPKASLDDEDSTDFPEAT